MLPSAVSLNLADADVGQRTERTSGSGSAEGVCCFLLTVSREVLLPCILLFISPICSRETKLFWITVLCLRELCVL